MTLNFYYILSELKNQNHQTFDNLTSILVCCIFEWDLCLFYVFISFVKVFVGIFFLLHFMKLFDNSILSPLLFWTIGDFDFPRNFVLSIFHDFSPIIFFNLAC